jgi:hypothetical protein
MVLDLLSGEGSLDAPRNSFDRIFLDLSIGGINHIL